MLIATVGVAVAFVLALLFSLETRGKDLSDLACRAAAVLKTIAAAATITPAAPPK
jgi:hypothetical protein